MESCPAPEQLLLIVLPSSIRRQRSKLLHPFNLVQVSSLAYAAEGQVQREARCDSVIYCRLAAWRRRCSPRFSARDVRELKPSCQSPRLFRRQSQLSSSRMEDQESLSRTGRIRWKTGRRSDCRLHHQLNHSSTLSLAWPALSRGNCKRRPLYPALQEHRVRAAERASRSNRERRSMYIRLDHGC